MLLMPQRADPNRGLSNLVIADGTMVAFGCPLAAAKPHYADLFDEDLDGVADRFGRGDPGYCGRLRKPDRRRVP
jgi:hypothetical protein